MYDHQRPATKPNIIRPSTLNTNVNHPSPALQGATSAFIPRASAATTSLSPVAATPSSAGARFAARAVASQSRSPPRESLLSDAPKNPSPERGRPIGLENGTGAGAARSAFSSQSTLTPSRPVLASRSPSAIAARYATSQPSSPARSPNRSPIRRIITQSAHRDDQNLGLDVTKALAGAIASMSAAQKTAEQRPTSVKNRVLDFEKIPPLPWQPDHSNLSQTLQGGLDTSQYPTSTSTDLVPAGSAMETVRGRAKSLGNIQSVDGRRTNISLPATTLVVDTQDGDRTGRASRQDRAQRPPIPPRISNKMPTIALRHADSNNTTHRGMTVNGLADAMVASSLASSRAASPAKKPLPPALRRRSRSFSALYDLSAKQEIRHSQKPLKPPRPMKHTLRKRSEEDEDEVELVKRGRRHWMRKHPNKHHEGDRKRWRDKVTEQERKRYEGLFAANRGLLIGPGYFQPSPTALADSAQENNRVVNVIVREIWERSRLPRDLLMEVYDLVAPGDDKALGREQFVVGMWLIDQRLKGRKLPVKVSSSVWASVRHPDGIKLKGHVI